MKDTKKPIMEQPLLAKQLSRECSVLIICLAVLTSCTNRANPPAIPGHHWSSNGHELYDDDTGEESASVDYAFGASVQVCPIELGEKCRNFQADKEALAWLAEEYRRICPYCGVPQGKQLLSKAAVPSNSNEGSQVDDEKIGLPPLIPMLCFILGIATLGWGGWTVWISESDSTPRIAAGAVCILIGAIVTVYGISGLTDWTLRF